MIVRKRSLLSLTLILCSFFSVNAIAQKKSVVSELILPKEDKSKIFENVSVGMGIKNIEYSEGFEGNYPAINMAMESNKFGISGSYTFASTYEFIEDSSQETKVNTFTTSLFYKYELSSFRIDPKITAVYVDLQRPDLTNFSGDEHKADRMLNEIENRSGLYPGIKLSKTIDVWEISFDADLGFSYGLNISYKL